MKKFQYSFRYNSADLTYIRVHIPFDEGKREKEIFELLIKGYTCNKISEETGICARTIQRRRKEIYYKVLNGLSTRNIITDAQQKEDTKGCINIQEDVFCVYVLVFPNHKMYVGQTRNPFGRWSNGQGYKENIEMYNDILNYGWSNILKSIPYKNLSRKEAVMWEEYLTILYDTCEPSKGYNKRLGDGGKL